MTIVTKAAQNAMAHCDIDYDDIIGQMLDTTTPIVASKLQTTVDSPVRTAINAKRERLVAFAVEGHAKQYLGRDLTSEQIDTMADLKSEKLYTR